MHGPTEERRHQWPGYELIIRNRRVVLVGIEEAEDLDNAPTVLIVDGETHPGDVPNAGA